MPEVIGLGDVALDLILEVDRIPETNSFEALKNCSMQGGGKVPTAIVTLARLGIQTGLMAPVGDDRFGRFCLDDLKKNGVDVSHMIIRRETHTNFCICLAEQSTGGRSFIGKLGEAVPLKTEELDREYINSAHFLHLWKMDDASAQAADWIHMSGGKVVMDADRYTDAIEKNIEKTDVFICSEYYWDGMYGRNAKKEEKSDGVLEKRLREIRERGPSIAILTLGRRGMYGADERGFFHVPSYLVPVMDTTGAGDVFHGAYICGLVKGMDAREAAQFASAVAAVKCTALGGRAGIPDYETVLKFIKTGKIDMTAIESWIEYYRSAFYGAV